MLQEYNTNWRTLISQHVKTNAQISSSTHQDCSLVKFLSEIKAHGAFEKYIQIFVFEKINLKCIIMCYFYHLTL